MPKGPNTNVAQFSIDDQLEDEIRKEIEQAVAGGLVNLNLRGILGMVLSNIYKAERSNYLSGSTSDKGNGTYARGLKVGSIPVGIEVPRTRSGKFRPTTLPSKYERGYSDETRPLLLGMLSSSRSINAAKTSLRELGLSVPEAEIESIAAEFIEELDLRNTKPVDPDLLAVFIDGKYIEVREGERLRPSCLYTAVGLHLDGKKKILAAVPRPGRENLEDWKKVLRGLIERGLRRVMILVQDDFSGLLPITKSLFPGADVQLCVVHMQRNSKKHLNREDAAEFNSRLRTIKASWDTEFAAKQFDDLCNRFSNSSPVFIKGLKKKRNHYLAFLKYPDPFRKALSTTNVVEAYNGQIEKIRINNGGYFHSENVLKFKLGINIKSLEEGKWKRPNSATQIALHQLNVMFVSKFESEE